ncbi:MAG: HAD family hydrolase [Candidatus Diapherotrites archaeon]|nr:HAD family hydrolase [Candidatus Diapherotrites archaeon]MDZ4256145.1 HAD family hydrolase [archaeon]
MLKAVIFDFDDTLVKSGMVSFQNHCRTARALGLPKPSFNMFLRYWGKPWHTMVVALFPHYDVNAFIAKYHEIRKGTRYPLIPGALDTLNFLREHHIETAILSNKPTDQLWERISHTALNPKNFLFVFGEQSTRFKKPDARVFDEVLFELKKERIRKHEVLYVGDLTVDYFAARGNNIDFCGVLSGFHSKAMFTKHGLNPQHLIPSVKDLPPWLVENRYITRAHGKGY